MTHDCASAGMENNENVTEFMKHDVVSKCWSESSWVWSGCLPAVGNNTVCKCFESFGRPLRKFEEVSFIKMKSRRFFILFFLSFSVIQANAKFLMKFWNFNISPRLVNKRNAKAKREHFPFCRCYWYALSAGSALWWLWLGHKFCHQLLYLASLSRACIKHF